MSSSTTVSSHAHRRASKLQRRMTWTGLLTILSLIVSLFPQVVGSPMPTASAHNLNASVVYVYFDANTQAYPGRSDRHEPAPGRHTVAAARRRVGHHH